jgi:putative cell wall-binding protein
VAQQFEADIHNTLVSNGRNWPDALAGAAYAGVEGIPVLLTRPTDVPDVVMTELTDHLAPERLVILGGTAAVSQNVEDELNEVFPFE